jgi:hypothetical protein
VIFYLAFACASDNADILWRERDGIRIVAARVWLLSTKQDLLRTN